MGRYLVLSIFILGTVLITAGCLSKNKVTNSSYQPQTRIYYVAAEEGQWDYAPFKIGAFLNHHGPEAQTWLKQTTYSKVRFIEYSDDTFTQKKAQPEWLGLMGPIIRGVTGDTIKVVFYNKGKKPYSLHPHGVSYDKDNEGAVGGRGGKIAPGAKYTYTWQVPKTAAPQPEEGGSKVWLYHSHVDSVQDVYDGLFGAIIITAPEYAAYDGRPNDVSQEFVTTFMIFDESTENMDDETKESHLKHAINGYIFHNLPGLTMKKGEPVRWHLLALGTEVDLHTAHWHGSVVKSGNTYTDVIELLPASMKSVTMVPEEVGTWMYHCHVADHITAGMMADYTVTE